MFCCSTTIQNIYFKKHYRTRNKSACIKVHRIFINNIRYADDTVLIAETLEDHQGLINKINTASNKFDLTLNTKKASI